MGQKLVGHLSAHWMFSTLLLFLQKQIKLFFLLLPKKKKKTFFFFFLQSIYMALTKCIRFFFFFLKPACGDLIPLMRVIDLRWGRRIDPEREKKFIGWKKGNDPYLNPKQIEKKRCIFDQLVKFVVFYRMTSQILTFDQLVKSVVF